MKQRPTSTLCRKATTNPSFVRPPMRRCLSSGLRETQRRASPNKEPDEEHYEERVADVCHLGSGDSAGRRLCPCAEACPDSAFFARVLPAGIGQPLDVRDANVGRGRNTDGGDCRREGWLLRRLFGRAALGGCV